MWIFKTFLKHLRSSSYYLLPSTSSHFRKLILKTFKLRIYFFLFIDTLLSLPFFFFSKLCKIIFFLIMPHFWGHSSAKKKKKVQLNSLFLTLRQLSSLNWCQSDQSLSEFLCLVVHTISWLSMFNISQVHTDKGQLLTIIKCGVRILIEVPY